MEPTIVVALVTAIAAIVAPLITSIVHSRKDYKIKKLEIQYEKKINAFANLTERYKSLTYDFPHTPYAAEFQAAAMQCAVLSKKRALQVKLIELGKLVMDSKLRTENSDELYELCAKLFCTEM